ncbi:MAG: potassium-transporting ATPase subunit KdpC [Solirubrobacteraceae bacterium]
MKLRKELTTALIAVLALTVLLGVAYPLAMTGIAQVAFPGKANGSQIKAAGKVVGSSLIAKPFTSPAYFHPRPSQTNYSASATAFSNRGPNQTSARFFYRDQLAAYLRLEGRYSPGLTKARVPVDAVTTSASGVDPHISVANARIQANRVATVRRMPLTRVRQLVAAHTDGRFLGLFGEPGVNVLELNLALDKEAPVR